MIKGSCHNPETIKKMREIKTGKKASLITKIKMSKAHKGENNGFYGKKHTLETRIRLSKSHSGENCSAETRRKLSESRKGTKASLETRIKLRKANGGENNGFYGKKHTLETKRKISDFRKTVKLTDEHKRKIAESLKGEKCHLWKGGISFFPYGLEFNKELKEQIRARDNHLCQECSTHQSKLFSKNGKPEKLSVHHIDYDKLNSRSWNLISLCKSCHCKTNLKREYWTAHFKKKIISVQQKTLKKLFYKDFEERIKKQNIKVFVIDEARSGMSYAGLRVADQMNKMLNEGFGRKEGGI